MSSTRLREGVPAEVCQQMLEDSGLSATEAARRMGWARGDSGDGARLKRAIGLLPHRTARKKRYRKVLANGDVAHYDEYDGTKYEYTTTVVKWDVVNALVHALDVWPQDYDI